MPESCIQPLGEQLLTSRASHKDNCLLPPLSFEPAGSLGGLTPFARLDSWHAMLGIGLKTARTTQPVVAIAMPGVPILSFIFYTTVAGLRPTKPGFVELEVNPQLGKLDSLSVVMPHPEGQIVLDITGASGTIREPPRAVAINRSFPPADMKLRA